MRGLARIFGFGAFTGTFDEGAGLSNEDPRRLDRRLYQCIRPECGGRRWLRRPGSKCKGIAGQALHPLDRMRAIHDDGQGETPRAIINDEGEDW